MRTISPQSGSELPSKTISSLGYVPLRLSHSKNEIIGKRKKEKERKKKIEKERKRKKKKEKERKRKKRKKYTFKDEKYAWILAK
jgi:hypothetical protein